MIFFLWNVLFLGVADAVFIFTALLKPVRAYITNLGIRSLVYLDDVFTLGQSLEQAKENRDRAVDVLNKAGFIVSQLKAEGPSNRIKYLGLDICSSQLAFFIPEQKVEKIKSEVSALLQTRRVKLRTMASFLGFLQSCSRALGPMVRMRTRQCYTWLMTNVEKIGYEAFIKLTDPIREELTFWRNQIEVLNGFHFSPSLSVAAETRLVVVTDSSQLGSFGFQYQDKYQILLRRGFNQAERRSSSTMRELLALKFIYTEGVAAQFQGKKILHLTDNQAVESIMLTGSKKPEIQDTALAIFMACRTLKIDLKVEWRPRDHFLLAHADLGSKSFDESNVSLSFDSFAVLLEVFAEVRIDVDGFASHDNRKADRGARVHWNKLFRSEVVSFAWLLLFPTARSDSSYNSSPRYVWSEVLRLSG